MAKENFKNLDLTNKRLLKKELIAKRNKLTSDLNFLKQHRKISIKIKKETSQKVINRQKESLLKTELLILEKSIVTVKDGKISKALILRNICKKEEELINLRIDINWINALITADLKSKSKSNENNKKQIIDFTVNVTVKQNKCNCKKGKK